MDRFDIVVVGAGIIGLAVADRLSRAGRDILVLEKEPSFGQHCSSRNSEVIHSGIYYPPDSLKARLCVDGNELLYRYLRENGIRHRRCGKIVVATSEDEAPALESLLRKGEKNGVSGLRILTAAEVRRMEPLVRCCAGLLVPSTGIMDTHQVMKRLEASAKERGALVVYNAEVTSVEPAGDGFRLAVRGEREAIETGILVNCAGLWSEEISKMAGIDSDSAAYRLSWNKGEYFKTSRYRNMSRLIYPVPEPDGAALGIHTVVRLDGELSFGPNSYSIDRIDYSVDGSHLQEFVRSVGKYMDISADDIWPDSSGIRPKLQGAGGEERDFVISSEEGKGLPGFVNLIGIESPGLTCCLRIAEAVTGLVG